jgi:hypothetical protein
MPDYRNFADSIFSPEIWQNEGRVWLILALSLLAVISVVFLFARSYRNEAAIFASFYTGIVVVAAMGGTLLFGSFVVEGFNQEVANHNIGVKYDDSKINISYHSMRENTVYARYTDGASQIDDQVKFVFEKNSVEPFIFKSTGSAENFEKITAAISKAR